MGLSEEPQVEVGEEGTSYAVLVGVVSTTAPVPFVMARLVELEHDALAEKGKGGKTPEHAELHSDLRAKLAEVGEAIRRTSLALGSHPLTARGLLGPPVCYGRGCGRRQGRRNPWMTCPAITTLGDVGFR